MAGTSTANWRAAMAKGTVEPVHAVTIQTASTTYNIASGITADLGYDIAVDDIAGFGKHHDPVTRRTSIDQIDLTLSDAWGRPLVVAERLKGAKVTIKTGTRNLAGADFRTRFVGLVDDYRVEPERGGVVVTCVDALTFALQNQTRRQWINKHPLTVAYQILIDSGVPASLVDTSSFASTSYTSTMSHWVVDQSVVERFAIRAGIIGIGSGTTSGIGSIDAQRSSAESLRDIQSDAVAALSLLETVALILPGMITVGDDGKITFVEYDDSAAAEVHFTTSDYSDFETVEQYGNQTNEVTVAVGANGREVEYSATYGASQTAHAYPGESGREVVRDIDAGWFGGLTGIGADMTNVQTTMTPAGARLFGFCGSQVPDDWPATSQNAVVKLSEDRPGYWLIDDPAGREIVKATALVLDESARAVVPVSDGDSIDTFDTPVPLFADATIARAQLGTAAAAHVYKKTTTEPSGTSTRFTLAHDVTIPVALANYHLKRFGYGCPVIRFKAASFGADIYELGDVITIDNDEFVSYGLDGLSSSTKWEIIGKEFDPYDSQPGARFTCALIRTDTVTATYGTLNPGHVINSVRHLIDGARAFDAYLPFVGRGFELSNGGGLVLDASVGAAGNGFNRGLSAAVQNLTLRASRDSYVSIDTRTGTTIVRDVATGAGDPGREEYEASLGWAAAGAASISSVTVDKDVRSLGVGRIERLIGRAYLAGVQTIASAAGYSKILFDTVDFDLGTPMFLATKFYQALIPTGEGGVYDVSGSAMVLALGSGYNARLAIWVNGAQLTAGDFGYNDSGAGRDTHVSVEASLVQLSAADYVEIYIATTDPTSRTIQAVSDYGMTIRRTH
jgi:hypothetical protein